MQAQSLSEISVDCGSANILTLAEEQLSYEGMLSIENPDHDISKKSVVYHSHFTEKRKIIFLAKGYTSACPIMLLPRAHAQGVKQSVCPSVVVRTKTARSGDIGTWPS
jgi:hypothetical protein